MAITKTYTREVFDAGSAQVVQTLSTSDTGTTVNPYGVSKFVNTAANDKVYGMGAPIVGLENTLIADLQGLGSVTVNTDSTATTIFGTTNTQIAFSTGAGRYRHLQLVGLSTSEWAIVSSSTGVTLAAP